MKCTSCQTELPEGFGVITCPHCGSIFSLDLDGNLEAFDVALPVESAPELSSDKQGEVEEFQDLMSLEVADITPTIESNANSSSFETLIEPEAATSLKLKNLLSDVAKDSDFVFKLEISKLDHKDIQSLVLSFLSEPRFGLETSELKKMVLTGKVVLPKASPLLAREIILGLRDSAAEIRWTSRGN